MKKHSSYPQFKHLNIKPEWQEFVYWYCHPSYNYNQTRAYCKAYGLSAEEDYRSAATCANRLLKNVEIMEAIDIERDRRLTKHEDIANYVLSEWLNLARLDVTQIIEMAGATCMVKKIEDIPAHLRTCIKSIKNTAEGVDVTFHDKNKALENLARALGMFVDKTQQVNEDYESLVDRVNRKKMEKDDE